MATRRRINLWLIGNKVPINYYIYVYLDPRKQGKHQYGCYCFDYEPFYVGKGNGSRYLIHTENKFLKNDVNKHKANKISKILRANLKPIVIKYKKDILLEQDAFDLEKNMIATIGRSDLKIGPLTNLTDGGEGSSGHKKPKLTIEQKRHLSLVLGGKNNPNYGKHWSPEVIKKLRDARSKQIITTETKNKMSIAAKGNKWALGRKHTQEELAKMRLAMLGKKNPMFGKHTNNSKPKNLKDCQLCLKF